MDNGKTIAILTALDLEYEAVREHLSRVESYTHERGTRWEIGVVPDGSCRIAIGDVGKGNLPSAVLAERAISELGPLALFFVGVAGTPKRDVNLGDVVVATHVYAYHGGSSEDGEFRARPRVWEAPHQLAQLAGDIARSASWVSLLRNEHGPGPRVHRAPIAAGEAVLKSRTSIEARRLLSHYQDTAAVEMEGAGVAQAAQLNDFPATLIRGISDYADADKHAADGAGWQQIAARRAAAFAITLAGRLAAESAAWRQASHAGTGRQGRHAAADGSGNPSSSFSNVAQGNAQVGVQAGQIFGGAFVGQQAPRQDMDLAKKLKNLQLELEEAHHAGSIDEQTLEAARVELTIATESRPTGDEQPERRFVLALKRLKGLLEDVAEFGAKVAAILTGFEGLR